MRRITQITFLAAVIVSTGGWVWILVVMLKWLIFENFSGGLLAEPYPSPFG
jgi:hypothetical protein